MKIEWKSTLNGYNLWNSLGLKFRHWHFRWEHGLILLSSLLLLDNGGLKWIFLVCPQTQVESSIPEDIYFQLNNSVITYQIKNSIARQICLDLYTFTAYVAFQNDLTFYSITFVVISVLAMSIVMHCIAIDSIRTLHCNAQNSNTKTKPLMLPKTNGHT